MRFNSGGKKILNKNCLFYAKFFESEEFSIVPFFSSSLLLLPITKNKNVLVLRKFSMTFDILKLAQECVKIPRPKSDCKFHLPKFFRSTLSKKGSVIGSWNEKNEKNSIKFQPKIQQFLIRAHLWL